MPQIKVRFEGICTHLIPDNPTGIKFQLENGAVWHRVVIPNSALIATHIAKTRPVPPHIPKLIVPSELAGDEFGQAFVARGDGQYELSLDTHNVAISFDGVLAGPPPNSWSALKELPHIYERAPNLYPQLRNSVQTGWGDHYAAYVDFTSGLQFSVEKVKENFIVTATLDTVDKPAIVLRLQNNDGTKKYYPMKTKDWDQARPIVVSNVPVIDCGDSDYLLHYFVTTLDLLDTPPTWTDPSRPGPEVYCSSSTYP